MKLATRVRDADPLAGRLPGQFPPPPVQAQWIPEPTPSRAPRARWVAALVATACVAAVGVVLLRSDARTSPATFTETLRVSPATRAAASAGVLEQRLATLGLRGWHVETRGGRIFASCAGCSAPLPGSVTQPGALRVYDWEANLLDSRCRPQPEASPPGAGGLSRAAAVRRAARCPGSRVVKAFAPAAWYVLRDRPALTGRQLTDPRVASLHGEPMVTLGFTPDGRKRWQALTRGIVERGRREQRPGTDPVAAAQHFAIVLDDRVLSTPYINPQVNPDRFDSLEIAGGFSAAYARTLAALLKSGALPARVATAAP